MDMPYRERWRAEIAALEAILAGFDLTAETKWGKPCYTLDGTNVVIIEALKDWCGLGFFQGALMKDPKERLIQLGQTQAARMLPFESAAQIGREQATIKAYVREAMAIAKAGLKVETKPREIAMPDEFAAKLRTDPRLKKAYEALTPGRQRSYLFHFAEAKQPATRLARIEKAVPSILAGRGHLERP